LLNGTSLNDLAAAIQQENHMKQLSIAILFLILLTGSFFGGSWYQDYRTSGNKPFASVRADNSAIDQDSELESDDLPPGTVRISPDRQQMVGIRTGVVEKTEGEYFIRAVGRVAADEKRIYRLVAAADGWIRETYANDTGTLVKKTSDWPLFTILSSGPPSTTTYPSSVHR
jgi:hypothetical protein